MKERKAKKTSIRVDANVLIAEDTELNQFIISEILQPFGLKFEFANTGLEAVSLFENKSFDIVFMDCLMPEMDGYAATKLIREMPEGKDTPIIALTANALEEAKNKCFAAGMNDFLSKPFVEKDLISMFKKYLPKQVIELKLGGSMQDNSDQKVLIKNKFDEFEKLMGKEKIIILVQRTLEESQKYIALLKDSDNLVDKRRAVHSLKSTSANYNYMVMAEFAQEFEKQLVEENTVNLAENTQQLEEFCSQLCLYLKEISE